MKKNENMLKEEGSRPNHGTNQREMPAPPESGADHSGDVASRPEHGTRDRKRANVEDGSNYKEVASRPSHGTRQR